MEKRLIHKVISAVCAVSFLFSLAGCGGNGGKDTDPGDTVSRSGTTAMRDPAPTAPAGQIPESSLQNPESYEEGASSNADDSENNSPKGTDGNQESTGKQLSPDGQGTTASSGQAPEGTKQGDRAEKATQYPLTVVDDAGRKIVIKKKPERLACVSGTYLNTIYQIGGTAYIRSDSSGGGTIPEEAKDMISVGNTVNVNVELLMANAPDLVICQKGLHDMLAAQLVAARIPTLVLEMKGYEDVIHDIGLIGTVIDRQKEAEDCVDSLKTRVKAITSKIPEKKLTAVILYATSSDVSVKLDNSIAGDVAKLLGIKNIASGIKPEMAGADYSPFSLETIVAAEPDIVLVTTMVSSREQAETRIRRDLESNPGWNGLKAVREGKIYYLPQSYFLYNPGTRYDLALEYMAKLVFPEVFGSVDE